MKSNRWIQLWSAGACSRFSIGQLAARNSSSSRQGGTTQSASKLAHSKNLPNDQ